MKKVLELAQRNLSEPIGGWASNFLSNAGLMENAAPWRELCSRVVKAFFPESAYVVRVWEKSGGLDFQIHRFPSGDLPGGKLLSISALCCALDEKQLASMVAKCAIEALDMVGYADQVEDVPYITTERHGKMTPWGEGVIVGQAADVFLRQVAEATIEDEEKPAPPAGE